MTIFMVGPDVVTVGSLLVAFLRGVAFGLVIVLVVVAVVYGIGGTIRRRK